MTSQSPPEQPTECGRIRFTTQGAFFTTSFTAPTALVGGSPVSAPVFSGPPLNGWSPGSIGHEPQQRKDLLGYVLMIAALFLLVAAVFAVVYATVLTP